MSDQQGRTTMEMNMDFVIEILTEYLHRERQFDDGPTSHEIALVGAIGFLEEIKSQLATREAECPKCGAASGEPCRTAKGKAIEHPHIDREAARYDAAMAMARRQAELKGERQ